MKRLSPRQAQVASLLLEGVVTTKDLAQRMSIKEGTVKVYLHQMYLKRRIPDGALKRVLLTLALYRERNGENAKTAGRETASSNIAPVDREAVAHCPAGA